MAGNEAEAGGQAGGENLRRLKALLEELFMFDQADLDFGIYRIMNLRREEIRRFLDDDLLPQVREALGDVAVSERAAIEREIREAEAGARQLSMNPDDVPMVQELRRKYNAEPDIAATEEEVYSHLITFFRRYYKEGDFISQRRYKEGVYAIPYEGEEVKLHWANADQYYVKSAEHFRDYTFLLSDGHRVHFKLVEASTETDNNRAQNGNDRRFILADNESVTEQDGELVVRFEYRSDVESRKRDDVNAEAAQRILNDPAAAAWQLALGRDVRPDGAKEALSVLRRHLNVYTAKNEFDYFIHKDLRGFLRRELDFYVKNEVMHLDDIDQDGMSVPDVERYLDKLRAIRRIGHKIIDFLAQLEDFQKRLWLKKRFVVETSWCVTLDRVPEELYAEIAENDRQREEWLSLFAINELDGYSERLEPAFLRANPHLVVDTSLFSRDFCDRWLASIDDLDDLTDGVLVSGDNSQALGLLASRFRGCVQCAYIDPPFNTGTDDFAYKDGYQESSWLAMIDSRVAAMIPLLTTDGTFYAHIDYKEKERLRLLLDQHLTYITEVIWRIGWISGYKSSANKWIRNHDTIYQYARTTEPFFQKEYIPYPEGYTRRDGSAPTGQGYPIEDTWNCNELDSLNSIQIMSFSKEKVGDQSLTQKNENLLARMIKASTRTGDVVLDFFLGSGTTTAAAQKLGRRWLGIESGSQFDNYIVPRMKRVLWGEPYGISEEVNWAGGGLFKVIRLESYEDALSNLEVDRTEEQQSLLDAQDDLREEYTLRYWLDVETRASPSLLNIKQFDDPWSYTLKIAPASAAERRPVTVDLVETFNYLIGLRVKHVDVGGEVTMVQGTVPSGERVLVIWRKVAEMPSDELNRFLFSQGTNPRDVEFDVVYVNGDNHLENARGPDETWKVRLIEDEFRRLMFETADGT